MESHLGAFRKPPSIVNSENYSIESYTFSWNSYFRLKNGCGKFKLPYYFKWKTIVKFQIEEFFPHLIFSIIINVYYFNVNFFM